MRGRLHRSHVLFGIGWAAVLVVAMAAEPAGQRGRGGGGDEGPSFTPDRTRLQILTEAFKLERAQRDEVKKIFDEAHKSAAPIRGELAKARLAIGAAVQSAKTEAEIDEAIAQYATQATEMTAVEMKAMAGLMRTLTEEQRASTAALQGTFFLMRGMFLTNRWDDVPDILRSY